MLNSGRTSGHMETSAGVEAERSEVPTPAAAGDRSMPPGSSQTGEKPDRRRTYRTSPNSRLSRPGREPGASSHPQGRDFAMTLDDSVQCSVGIDVSKDRLDVHVLPEGLSFQVPNSPDGHHELLARLPEPGACRIV